MVTSSSDTATDILTAATQMMLKQGDAGLRVDVVAADAGCNKRLIYHYFGNREGLIAAVYQRQYAALVASENGLSAATKRFLEQQLLPLLPVIATTESVHAERPQQDDGRKITLRGALALLMPLLLRSVALPATDTAAGIAAAEKAGDGWQKVALELVSLVFADQMKGTAVSPQEVNKQSLTKEKPRYRLASTSRRIN
ncbi:MAG: TetR/AcrR family transcriptional regulator [bacterium]